MDTDNTLQIKAMNVLISALDIVDTGRFINIVKRDTFDYTEWQRKLWEEQSISEIHEAAIAWMKRV
ncbi:MAG: hypothetical protein FWD05_07360 [Oscillospiraceae bacterium]|nr:hypothetical protein [Oscillospiraceae bacterium]